MVGVEMLLVGGLYWWCPSWEMLSFGRCVLCWLPFSLEGFDLIKGMGVKGDTSISSKKQRGKDSAVKEDRHGHLACNALHSWKTNGKRA